MTGALEIVRGASFGASAGIAFLPGGIVRAASEPVRRGGGSANP